MYRSSACGKCADHDDIKHTEMGELSVKPDNDHTPPSGHKTFHVAVTGTTAGPAVSAAPAAAPSSKCKKKKLNGVKWSRDDLVDEN